MAISHDAAKEISDQPTTDTVAPLATFPRRSPNARKLHSQGKTKKTATTLKVAPQAIAPRIFTNAGKLNNEYERLLAAQAAPVNSPTVSENLDAAFAIEKRQRNAPLSKVQQQDAMRLRKLLEELDAANNSTGNVQSHTPAVTFSNPAATRGIPNSVANQAATHNTSNEELVDEGYVMIHKP